MSLLSRWFGRHPNPKEQIGLFGEDQAEVEGFALTSPKGKPTGRARPGQGTQGELVSRKVSREQMERMRERELAERHARKKRRKKNDVFDQRARDSQSRAEAARAAAAIARHYDIRSLADPGYIANVIESEIERFEDDISKPVVDGNLKVPWAILGMTGQQLTDIVSKAPMPAGVDLVSAKAAQAAAVRLANAYATVISQRSNLPEGVDPILDFLHVWPGRIAELLSSETAHTRIAEVEDALRQIQAHRRAIGMGPLDTHAAGWTEEDVLIEADRLRRHPNPLQDLKHRLI